MASVLEFEVKKEDEGRKLRDYLKTEIGLSSRLIRGSAVGGRIRIGNQIVKLNHSLEVGDIIRIELSKEESQDIEPEEMELDIVYEDEDLLVVNKSPFTVVHPTRSHPSGTLANGVLHHFRSKGESCIVRLVSRLDRDTSGLIIIAKNQYCHMFLAKEMERNAVIKGYTAVVWGNLKKSKGTINEPIYRPSQDSIKRVVDPRGQKSITHFEVVESFNQADLVRLRLETGRTHQIRVHLSYLGNPIIGDTLYGREEETLINRQALHASHLTFLHPRTKETISLSSDLPEDIKNLIRSFK
jgi:23S rRNA pseudouridine1911/1915/1917 synthase